MYADLQTIHNPTSGQPIPTAWGDQIRENEEFLIAPPGCTAYSATAQSVPNNVLTAMSAPSERFDNASMHNTSVNNSRITIPVSGLYRVESIVDYDTNATGHRFFELLVNGVTRYSLAYQGAYPGPTVNSASITLPFTAGDYVETRVRQTSGGNLDVYLRHFGAFWSSR